MNDQSKNLFPFVQQNNNKKLEEMECRYQQEIKTFHHQKHENEDKIKKLQEQLVTKSEADEKYVALLL